MENFFVESLKEIKEALVNLTNEYGQDTIELALWVVQINAIGEILWFTAVVVSLVTFFTIFIKVFIPWADYDKDDFQGRQTTIWVTGPPVMVILFVSAILSIPSLITVMAAVGYPELKIADEILSTVFK